MASDIAQAVIDKLIVLPPQQQQQVLEFVEKLEKKIGMRRTIGEIIEECFKDVPPEDLAEIPADASENIDHYLYGAPKR